MTQRMWTDAETNRLLHLIATGKTVKQAAEAIGRTKYAARSRLDLVRKYNQPAAEVRGPDEVAFELCSRDLREATIRAIERHAARRKVGFRDAVVELLYAGDVR